MTFTRRTAGRRLQDERHPNGRQTIPGRVECALYDRGGEGVAYHDLDAANHGSGELNPRDGTYLNQFRMDEGVDISYTKLQRTPIPIDDNPFDAVTPRENQLYVGWTEAGEWFNVTVEVEQEGEYDSSLLYTSNRGGTISFDVNGKAATGGVPIASTYDARDPVAWRQWHHWNVAPNVGRMRLPAGKVVLTLHVVSGGQMNFAYLDFVRGQVRQAEGGTVGRITKQVVCVALLVALTAGLAQAQVKTATGLVKGKPAADGAVTVYFGVPYAAPPVGDLRWRAPAAAEGVGGRARRDPDARRVHAAEGLR